jgi:heme-degrading monooxygenase HmoA
MEIAKKMKPPYYAVIFTSILSENSENYNSVAKRMLMLVKNQPGFLGFESAREEIGITISYWESMDAIKEWANNVEHIEAKQKGKKAWYKCYMLRITKVEKEFYFDK